MSEFYVGQEVVCVDDAYDPSLRIPGFHYTGWEAPVVRGQHYKVEAISIHIDGQPTLTLEGIRCQFTPDKRGLHRRRFRPIKPESIAIFREMCVSKKPLVPVE